MNLRVCTSAFVFTKVMQPVVNYLRSRKLLSVIYLDDILYVGEDEETGKENLQITLDFLTGLDFLINYEKSNLSPSTRCTYLGFIIDSAAFTIELTPKKRESLSKLTNRFLRKQDCSIRDFAQLIGSLVAACPAAEYGALHCKTLERAKCEALEVNQGNFDRIMRLPVCIKSDLEW